MPFLAPGNPSSPLPQSLSPQFPPWELMMRLWGNAQQQAPWVVQPGFQQIPHQFPQVPGAQGGMLAQPVADIYKFPPKQPGMLGATEGAGGRGLGSRGGGLLGSQWRDPRFIQNYEVQQGLKPGSLQPVQPRAADVMPMRNPVPPTEKQIAERQAGGLLNRMENDPNWRKVSQEEIARLNAQPGAPTMKDYLDAVRGPTPAQMARPVKQTPEISAKLAKAREQRATRAKKGLPPVTGPRSIEAIEADLAALKARNRPSIVSGSDFTLRLDMTPEVWKSMNANARQRWFDMQGAYNWTPQQRVDFARFVKGEPER